MQLYIHCYYTTDWCGKQIETVEAMLCHIPWPIYINSYAVHGMAYDILLHHTLLSVYITIENLFISSYHKMEKCSYSLILAMYHFRLVHESINLHKPTSDQTILVSTISTNGIYSCTKEDITKGPVGTYAMLPWSILCKSHGLQYSMLRCPPNPL